MGPIMVEKNDLTVRNAPTGEYSNGVHDDAKSFIIHQELPALLANRAASASKPFLIFPLRFFDKLIPCKGVFSVSAPKLLGRFFFASRIPLLASSLARFLLIFCTLAFG